MKKLLNVKVLAPLIVLVILLLIPAPGGLNANAWYFFAIFCAVVIGLIFEPIPAAAIGFIGVSVTAVFRLVHAPGEPMTGGQSIRWALSGFSNGTVWMIFAAFMFSLAYKKTGLGRRIALLLIKFMGKRTLGLGYAISFADLVIAPFTPSNTARSGGTIYPIVSNIPPLFDSYPDKNPRAIGSYLSWTAFAACCVTSTMFVTALAPNVLASSILANQFNIQLEWAKWFLTVGIVSIPLFLLTPLLAYVLYPPTIKKSPQVPIWAGEELAKLGRLTLKEVLLLVFVFIALLLWIFGSRFLGINETTTAVLVVSAMILTGIINWDDFISNKSAWSTLTWFATLVAMAQGLAVTGFLKYLSDGLSGYLSGFSPNTVILLLLIAFIALHYFFASTTSHVTALLALFMTIGIGLLPADMIYRLALLLTGSLGLMGVITPYGTGPAPIWYGSGFLPQKTWWGLGFIFLIIYFVVYIPLGMLIT